MRLEDRTFPELRTWLFTKLPSECGLGGGWNLAARNHCSLLWELDLAGSLCLFLCFSLVWSTFRGGKKNKACQNLSSRIKRIEMWRCNKHISRVYYVPRTIQNIKILERLKKPQIPVKELLYICTHTYVCIYIHTHIHIHTYVYMCVYIYIYVYIFSRRRLSKHIYS